MKMKIRTTRKRLLSVLLAVAMVLTALPLTALPAVAATSGDFEYAVLSEADKTCEITRYTGSATALEIPSELDGYTVTSIGYEAFYGCTALESIAIPNSVTSIGEGAFEYCTALTSITIPDSVTRIKNYTFHYCTSLENITIPDSVTSIGDQAFRNCTALESITIPNSVTSIGDRAFYDCTSLTSITIPDSVTSIGGSAFYHTAYYNDATHWENDVLYIGNHLIKAKNTLSGAYTVRAGTKTIADEAFSGCTALTNITIPNSVTWIGDWAFSGCTALTSITIPNSVTSIGNYAFDNTAYYNDATHWENDVLYIGNHLIKAKDTLSGAYTVRAGTKTIAGYAFSDCTALTSVTIPDSVTSIGDWAFSGCASLTGVTIPNSVTSIGNYAFSGCTLLTTIYGYTGSYAETFANTNGYTFVALPLGIQDGDVNGDDKINAVDARWVLQAASGVRTFDATQTAAADVNGDGKVNAVDARWILQVASGARTL